jgi:hypothetical protein
MVAHVSEWRWSSYSATVGDDEAPRWLSCEWTLRQFGKRRKTQRARYAQFVAQGLGRGRICDALKGQMFLGTAAFAETMRQRLGEEAKHTQTEIPRVAAQSARKTAPLLTRFV